MQQFRHTDGKREVLGLCVQCATALMYMSVSFNKASVLCNKVVPSPVERCGSCLSGLDWELWSTCS